AEAEEPEWGALLRAAAIPRRLDEGVVGALRGALDDVQGNQAALQRLASYSFVLPDPEGRSYALHEEVRAVLLADWQVPERRARYVELSRALYDHALAAEQGWEALYHRFAFDPTGALAEFERRFQDAEKFYRRAECGALLAAADEQEQELDEGQRRWLRYYRARLAQVLDRWAEAAAGYRELLAELPPSPPASLPEGGERLRIWTLNALGLALDSQGKWAEAVEVYQETLKARRELGDRHGEGITLGNLGNVYYSQGRWEQAIECYQESLRIKRELGDRHGEGITLNNLGAVYQAQGRWDQAIECYEESLRIKRELGDRHGEGLTLGNLGNVHQAQGRWDQAIECYEASLRIKRELGNRHGEGQTLNNLGNVYYSQGRWEQAIECYQESLRIKRELGDRHGEGQTLNNLGQTYTMQGRWQEAKEYVDQSLPIRRELGDRLGEAYVLHNLGQWHKGQGQLDEAIARYREALAIRQELEAWPQVGETLHALAEVYRLRGDWAKAAEMAEQAAAAWRRAATTGVAAEIESKDGNAFETNEV
ncbi:MAG: tetratricopeptide repeat protein, partial [Anaerolineae bacterium]